MTEILKKVPGTDRKVRKKHKDLFLCRSNRLPSCLYICLRGIFFNKLGTFLVKPKNQLVKLIDINNFLRISEGVLNILPALKDYQPFNSLFRKDKVILASDSTLTVHYDYVLSNLNHSSVDLAF